LNSHLTKLQEKKYISIEKKFVDLRPRTVIFLNKEGKNALLKYITDFSQVINSIS
jgi:DNA-binding PadR family transcriptional regulator